MTDNLPASHEEIKETLKVFSEIANGFVHDTETAVQLLHETHNTEAESEIITQVKDILAEVKSLRWEVIADSEHASAPVPPAPVSQVATDASAGANAVPVRKPARTKSEQERLEVLYGKFNKQVTKLVTPQKQLVVAARKLLAGELQPSQKLRVLIDDAEAAAKRFVREQNELIRITIDIDKIFLSSTAIEKNDAWDLARLVELYRGELYRDFYKEWGEIERVFSLSYEKKGSKEVIKPSEQVRTPLYEFGRTILANAEKFEHFAYGQKLSTALQTGQANI